ncbi:hypothetical protein CJU90_0610 [Yarrowia sp. C11]|nr:hypothetical protein CKK34_2022 [Yarrowia sp. E02]KAG5372950.1 hypothetical protein CJU90_0610 [Yarrowia sp. C11]
MGHNFTYKAPSGEAYAAIDPEVLKSYRNSAPAKRDPEIRYRGHDPDLSQPIHPQRPSLVHSSHMSSQVPQGHSQGHSQVHSSQVHSHMPPSPLSPTGRMPYGYGSSHSGPPGLPGQPHIPQGIPQGYVPGPYSPGAYSPGQYSPQMAVPRSSYLGTPLQKMAHVQMSQVHSPMGHPHQKQLSPSHIPLSPPAEGYFPGTPSAGPKDYAPVEIQSTIGGPTAAVRRRNSTKSSKSSKSSKSTKTAKTARSTTKSAKPASTAPSLRPGNLSQADMELYESPAVDKLISVLEESVAIKKAEHQRRMSRSSRATSVYSSAPTTVSSASTESSSESTASARQKYEAEFLRRVEAKVELRNQKVKQAALLGEKGIKLVPPKKPATSEAPKPVPAAGWQGYLPWWVKKAPEEAPAPAAAPEPVETGPAIESLAAQYYQDLFQMMRDHDVPAVVGDCIVKGYEEAMKIEKEIKDETIRLQKEKEDAEKKAKEPAPLPVANTPAFLTVIIQGVEQEKDFGYKIPIDSIKTFKEFKNLMVLTFPSKAKHWQKECFQVFDETNNYFIMGQFWDKLIKRDTILAVSLTPLPPEKEKEPKEKGKPEAASPVPPKKQKEPSKFTKALMADFDKKKFNQNTTKMFKKLVEASTRPI